MLSEIGQRKTNTYDHFPMWNLRKQQADRYRKRDW